MPVRIDGADRLAHTLAQAVDDLDDLVELHEELGGVIVRAAAPLTPVDTGRLLAGTTAVATKHATSIVNAVAYAPVIHARRPFIAEAIDATEAEQLAAADDAIQTILNRIQGA